MISSVFDSMRQIDIEQAIADAIQRIGQMEHEEQSLRAVGNRVSIYKADAKRVDIRHQRELILRMKEYLRVTAP